MRGGGRQEPPLLNDRPGLMWRLLIGGVASGAAVNARCSGAAPAVRSVTAGVMAQSGVESSARRSEVASGVWEGSHGGLSAATLASGGGGGNGGGCCAGGSDPSRLKKCMAISLPAQALN